MLLQCNSINQICGSCNDLTLGKHISLKKERMWLCEFHMFPVSIFVDPRV